MRKLLSLCFIIVVFSFSNLRSAHADGHDMKNFLLASAYGTAAGAAVGLLSIAFSDDPDHNLTRVAKGASLGLYAGIGYGLFLVYGEQHTSSADDYGVKNISPIWLSVNSESGHLSGAHLNWLVSQF